MNTVTASSSDRPLIVNARTRNYREESVELSGNSIYSTVEREQNVVVLCESDSHLTDSSRCDSVYARCYAKPCSSM
jgi:hypothetical protein